MSDTNQNKSCTPAIALQEALGGKIASPGENPSPGEPDLGVSSKAATPSPSPSPSPAKALAVEEASAAAQRYELLRDVFFVGFMGAGKSSVARKLARYFRAASIDVDNYIVRREGCEIADIFAKAGESAFRDIEVAAMREIVAMPTPMFVSCGGGAVLRPENRKLLTQSGFCVHLLVDADSAAGRIEDPSTRPLFRELDDVRARCAARMPLYESVAAATIDTRGKTVNEISREVAFILKREGILCLKQE